MRFGLRELVFLMLLLGFMVASYFLLFAPRNAEKTAMQAERVAKEAKLQKLKLGEHIDDLGQEIGKLTEAIDMFEAKLPEAKEVEVMLQEVWQLATARGLTSRSFRTEQPTQSASYSEQVIKMQIIGDFKGFYGFLLDVERLSRITRILDMKLKKVRDNEGHIDATFSLTIYFEPETRKPQTSVAG